MAEDKARHIVSDIKSEEGTSPVAVTAKLKSEGICETIPENPQMDSSGLDMKKIYAFGDSNTYGFDPIMGGVGRYPKNVRWTGVIDLMHEYEVNNQGYNGLSIPYSDSSFASIGRSIKEYSPDIILIMIGSNDLLNMSPASCENVGIRLRQFLSTLCDCIPEHVQRMVLVAPPKMSLGDWTDPVIVNESHKFGAVYEAIASEKGLTFLNACEWDLPLCYDGVHLTEEAHLHFADKIISFSQMAK